MGWKPDICIFHGGIERLRAEDAAYLAGLIDGEGYIGVTGTHTSASAKGCKRGVAYRCHISVNMVEKAALQWAQEMTGLGRVSPKKASCVRHRPAWSWNVWSNEASQLALAILPYLHVKREQARNLIEFNSIMRQPGFKGLTDEEWDARERHWHRSRALNHRGVDHVAP
jgi:hypothetical protein